MLRFWKEHEQQEVIHLGILHALSGPASGPKENAIVDAELFAIAEINEQGGIMGRLVAPEVMDSGADPEKAARTLISERKVSAIFGCHMSICRKAVRNVVEEQNSLLIYPAPYEGLESSRNIIYLGATPNQVITPAVNWALENKGKRFLLIGSDFIWPHMVNEIAKDALMAINGEWVAELYIPLNSEVTTQIIELIKTKKPDVILSSLVGISAKSFLSALQKTGITAHDIPVLMAQSISETDLDTFSPKDLVGHYVAWSYFEALNREENQAFIKRFRDRYGVDRRINDIMQAAYSGIHLWAKAVERAQTIEINQVRQAFLGMSYQAPEGIISIDATTQHAWRSFYLGQFTKDKSIQPIWTAEYPISPLPYPTTRTKTIWDSLESNLYHQWNDHWYAPLTKTVQ